MLWVLDKDEDHIYTINKPKQAGWLQPPIKGLYLGKLRVVMQRFQWTSDYIAVDWGTTNRRAYRIANGVVNDSFEDDRGVLSVEKVGFDDAVADIHVRLGKCPMLLAGMIGSNKGWHHVPYIIAPAGASELAAGIVWMNETTGIVPGVCQLSEPDVMRGEEVQALGAVAAGSVPPDSLLCLPGTHSKWVRMSGGRIDSLHSAMTGEIFSLLKEHSILGDQLQNAAQVGYDFERGVVDALGGAPLLSALFAVRARHLLDKSSADDASYVSGLLIGTDVAAALARQDVAHIMFIGQPNLCALYAEAAHLEGKDYSVIDGKTAFVKGMSILMEGLG